MFDASFPEIVLILLVALIVIGPERLPKVARTMGLWVGRARSMFNSMRNEVEREIQLDELRKAERDLKKDLDLNRDVMEGEDKPASTGGKSGGGKSGRPRAKSGRAGGTESSGKQAAAAGANDDANDKQSGSGEDDGPKA